MTYSYSPPIEIPELAFAVSDDGTRIAFRDFRKEADGRPILLFVHATGFHGLSYLPMIALLQDDFRCVAVDLRSHGDSGESPGSIGGVGPNSDSGYAWERLGQDVKAVAECLRSGKGPSQAIFGFGHSSGAVALLLCEETSPGTLQKIYCYEPVMFPPGIDTEIMRSASDRLSGSALRRRRSFASEEEAFSNFASKPPMSAFDERSLGAYVHFGLKDSGDGALSLKCLPESEAKFYEGGSAHMALAGLGSIACPIRFACGGDTDSFGIGLMKLWAAESRIASYSEMEGLGHFGPLEDPVAASSDLRTFLS